MLLLAEAGSDLGNMAAIVAGIANAGFAAIVGWYLLTKAIPKMQQDFRDELKATRDDMNVQERERRQDHKDALTAVITHCATEGQRHEGLLKGEIAGFGKVIDDNREVLEEVRDALREFKDVLKDFLRSKT